MDNTRHQLKPSASGRLENPNNLRDKIQTTRDEIGRTVNTLHDRLSPDRMAEYIKSKAINGITSVKTQAGVTAELWASSEAERILNKSIPAALIGAGLAWIMARSIKASQKTKHRTRHLYSLDPQEEWPLYAPEKESGRTWSNRTSEKDTIKDQRTAIQPSFELGKKEEPPGINRAQEDLGEWTSEVDNQSQPRRKREREQVDQVKGEFQRYLQENSITIGVMVLAVGTVVGLSLPRTRKEDLWMGKTRDHLLGRVKAASKDIVPKARRAVRDMERTTRKIITDEIWAEKVERT